MYSVQIVNTNLKLMLQANVIGYRKIVNDSCSWVQG